MLKKKSARPLRADEPRYGPGVREGVWAESWASTHEPPPYPSPPPFGQQADEQQGGCAARDCDYDGLVAARSFWCDLVSFVETSTYGFGLLLFLSVLFFWRLPERRSDLGLYRTLVNGIETSSENGRVEPTRPLEKKLLSFSLRALVGKC